MFSHYRHECSRPINVVACLWCRPTGCACCWAQTTLRIAGHDDDVNAVVFLDAGSHLIATGSDDSLIKVCLPWPLLPPPLVRQSCCGLCIPI